MEVRCVSDCGRDEVYPATFGEEERTRLKLDVMMTMIIEQLTCLTQASKIDVAIISGQILQFEKIVLLSLFAYW